MSSSRLTGVLIGMRGVQVEWSLGVWRYAVRRIRYSDIFLAMVLR